MYFRAFLKHTEVKVITFLLDKAKESKSSQNSEAQII